MKKKGITPKPTMPPPINHPVYPFRDIILCLFMSNDDLCINFTLKVGVLLKVKSWTF